jgi:hypothetical protein
MEEIYRGSIYDINEGSMITIFMTEDPHGYPFWIAMVINIEKDNEYVISI